MKVRDRIDVITDLLLGAAHADRRFPAGEQHAVRALLCELLLTDTLPAGLEARIRGFDPQRFDLARAAADFSADPPMQKRRLLELVGQMCWSDGEYDLEEDAYIRELGEALGMQPDEYADLVIDYELEELRESFTEIRVTPADGIAGEELEQVRRRIARESGTSPGGG